MKVLIREPVRVRSEAEVLTEFGLLMIPEEANRASKHEATLTGAPPTAVGIARCQVANLSIFMPAKA